ncbi:BZ3500_MvSof-1268-A1-R1_Chr4-3g07378 [Microbotryum saponariae]|uniref:tRNA-5-taurinomethyluridine 2-sulfurtransferase n=1 Tax=Microbotryum saponariae TaxID=289078 RepID=A0A2X0LJ05_9BASI|nr:BZ3500_MvSof-1268-A1-R1_Chr4-3g07378 [Microbotryum saponariae]SDA07041.1 BZ3501_MvSof-1269-A2-R1_Chr4-2g07087 [Microbotryum saponariae]
MRFTLARFKPNPASLYPPLTAWNFPPRGSKIYVACSAGIDSSVTARLLLERDYDIRPVYMRNWDTLDENQTSGGCEWEKDWEQVQVLCKESLGGVKPTLVDLSKQYWNEVFERSLGEWERGVTPNPDVVCNHNDINPFAPSAWLNPKVSPFRREIKFRALPSILFDKDPNAYLATGHYARLSPSPLDPLEPALHRGAYPLKDQSYYLSTSPVSALKRTLFPLGEYRKDEVKEMARKWGLPDKITERKESMGICFVGKKGKRFRHWLGTRRNSFSLNEFRQLIQPHLSHTCSIDAYLPPKPGHIVLTSGKIVGQHQGLWQYTIGEGARLPGLPSRHFIGRKVRERNEIVVVPEDDHSLEIELNEPLIGVSPGQAVVLYNGTWCLGGGTIKSTTTLADLPQSSN